CSIAILLAAPEAFSQKFRKSETPVPGEYIIVLKEPPENSDDSRASLLTDGRNIVRAQFGAPRHQFTHVLLGLSAKMNEVSAIAISEDPRVDYVEENSIFHASTTETSAPYGLERIDVRPLPQPYTQTYQYNVTGSISYTTCAGAFGVHIYVVDSG